MWCKVLCLCLPARQIRWLDCVGRLFPRICIYIGTPWRDPDTSWHTMPLTICLCFLVLCVLFICLFVCLFAPDLPCLFDISTFGAWLWRHLAHCKSRQDDCLWLPVCLPGLIYMYYRGHRKTKTFDLSQGITLSLPPKKIVFIYLFFSLHV